jgi:hypothetical protein
MDDKVMIILNRQLNAPMIVIPAKAGIQAGSGCRIKSGMTEFVPLIAGLIVPFMEPKYR